MDSEASLDSTNDSIPEQVFEIPAKQTKLSEKKATIQSAIAQKNNAQDFQLNVMAMDDMRKVHFFSLQCFIY